MSDFPELENLRNPPIVEAVLDIDCDVAPGTDVVAMEQSLREVFQDRYPKLQKRLTQEVNFEAKSDQLLTHSAKQATDALLFVQDDGKQIVQVRVGGFSFNRLSPYTNLSDYLPEIERVWSLYVKHLKPVQIRLIRLRYINRILLPLDGLDLDRYLNIGPRLPDDQTLLLNGFLTQQLCSEKKTGNLVNIVMTSQAFDNESLAVIFDIAAVRSGPLEVTQWSTILDYIQSLRHLNNGVFVNSLTEKCLKLFQQ